MTRRALAAALLVFGASLSCSDSNGPVAGALTIGLVTPNSGQDGAIQFVITSPVAITGVTAAPGLRVFTDTLGTATRVVVTGTLAAGPIVSVGVADVTRSRSTAPPSSRWRRRIISCVRSPATRWRWRNKRGSGAKRLRG